MTLSAGIRYDWMNFDVSDQHLSDGVDNSGQRTMQAPSGSFGISYDVRQALVPYFNVASSFETPTTTELANTPNVTGGFNPDLDPQTALTWELGARGTRRWLSYSVAGYLIGITNAIVPYTEVGGRAYYTNAGKVNDNGIEARVDVTHIRTLRLFASYTYAHYRFETYRVVQRRGHRHPRRQDRAGRAGVVHPARTPGHGCRHGYVDVDQSFSTKVYAERRQHAPGQRLGHADGRNARRHRRRRDEPGRPDGMGGSGGPAGAVRRDSQTCGTGPMSARSPSTARSGGSTSRRRGEHFIWEPRSAGPGPELATPGSEARRPYSILTGSRSIVIRGSPEPASRTAA